MGSSQKRSQWQYLVTLWALGCVLLCALAWLFFYLHIRLATTGFCMLIVIVLLSLFDSFISSAIFSLCGAALLNVLFTPPVFSFAIAKTQDYLPLATFLVSSVVVTTLVRRFRRGERVQREQSQLLNLTHDAIIVYDVGSSIKFWNRAAESLYGWTVHEVEGKTTDSLLKTIYPESREAIEQSLRRDGFWAGELVHTRSDGKQVIVASRWTLQKDDRGKPLAILETHNDITGRKHAEELIRRTQAQYLAQGQRLSRTGSFGWTPATGELFWSDEAFRIYEQDPAIPATIETVRARLHPDDAHVFESMRSEVENGADRFDIEHRLLFPDGRVKHLHVVAHATEGNGRQFVGAVMDVTEPKRTEARLRQAESDLARASRVSALGELSASIAHEVGQPLVAIVTNGEAGRRWLQRTPPDFEEVLGCIDEMIHEANRAADIVQRVRRLMKGAPPEKQPVVAADLIREVVGLVRPELDRQGGCLVIEADPDGLAVLGDRVQLQQVLINMAINAMQAMSTCTRKGRLTIAASAEDQGRVLFSVTDNGPGISAENLPKLFDAFFTTRSDGMGMGLAICASIVDAHGGSIRAVNHPDGGSTFSFSLPAFGRAIVA